MIRNKYFKIKNKTNNPRDIKQHKSLKNEVQRRIRQAYWEYVNNIFEETDDRSQQQKPRCGKRFWSFIKHARTDKLGIPSLKLGNSMVTDPCIKAELLNDHSIKINAQHNVRKRAI